MKVVKYIKVTLCIAIAISSLSADILLDDFKNYFGGANDQCHISEALGYATGGPDSIAAGRGWWRPVTDTLGAIVTNGSGEILDSTNYTTMVEDTALHILFKTHLSSADQINTKAFAGIQSTFIGDTVRYFDFSNLSAITITLKGSGKIRLVVITKDIVDLGLEQGFYGIDYTLTPVWQELTIPTGLLQPEPGFPPSDSLWSWDHGKNAVRSFAIRACPDNDTTTHDSADVYVNNIIFTGLDYDTTFGFTYVPLANLSAVPDDSTLFVIDTTITLNSAIPDAQIYYTTDGTDPDTANDTLLYTEPFVISGDTVVVKAVIVNNGLLLASKVWTYYTYYPQILITADPPDSTHFNNDTTVTLTIIPSDASVHYTLDGTVPTSASPSYTGPIIISQNTVLRVMAYKIGYTGVYGTWTYFGDVTNTGTHQDITNKKLSIHSCRITNDALLLDIVVPNENPAKTILFDMTGKKVFTHLNSGHGPHTITIQKAKLGSGVYFYRISNSSECITERIIIP